MKKLAFGMVGGLGTAMISALAGLPHLSATIVTLTVFCTAQAVLFLVGSALCGFMYALSDRFETWRGPVPAG